MADHVEKRITEKAEYVAEAVGILAEKRDSLSFETYVSDREQRDVVEREFETAIEACIDIGKMLLRDRAGDVPDTNAQVFRELGDCGVLDADTATSMAQAAGFRNVLSHRYGTDIDHRDVYNFLQHELPIFRDYLRQVRATLQ